MFNKFLVPINPDDQDIASGIVAHATWLAGRLASEVVFLSVIPFDRTNKAPGTAEIFERAKFDVERRLEGLVESTGSPGSQAGNPGRIRCAGRDDSRDVSPAGLRHHSDVNARRRSARQGTCRQRDDERDRLRACSCAGS